MSLRDKATKHAGNARIDHGEAQFFTKGTARSTKASAKREMRKARRALDRAEIEELAEMGLTEVEPGVFATSEPSPSPFVGIAPAAEQARPAPERCAKSAVSVGAPEEKP